MEKWFIKNRKADFMLIAQHFSISPVLARLIVNRGIISNEELEAYLNPDIDKLYDPFLLKGMTKAITILSQKIQEGSRIRIIGDYDVDGVISTYILTRALIRCGANVDYEIPDRIKDGYGINCSIIEEAHRDQVDTLLTCDNGIAAVEEIAYAKSLGMTVIITDHHDIPYLLEGDLKKDVIPDADVVINPKQQDCTYPFKDICGATVAYKLIEALYKENNIPKEESRCFLEFVAIATVCDVMDLVEENRIIVKKGLDLLHSTKNLGLKALIDINQLEEQRITTYHLGFVIGPCINASGRLDSAKIGLKLLLSESVEEANKLAQVLKSLNEDRKQLTNTGVIEATKQIEETAIHEDRIIVVYLEDCHESIAGIIAGRIKERYNKPTIVLTKGENGAKGSARSIEEYNMHEGLTECSDLLTKFGGHPMAAGLSLQIQNISALRGMLNTNCNLTEEDLARKVSFDMVLPFEGVTIPLIKEFKKLEPFGKGNAKPTFAIRNIRIIKGVKLGKNQNVIKLTVAHEGEQKRYTAMLFSNVIDFEEQIKDVYGEGQLNNIYEGLDNVILCDFVFYPDINVYQGYENIQFIIQHYRFQR